MSLPNQTIQQTSKNLARLEQEKSIRGTLVYIESISPDQTRAIIRTTSDTNKGDVFQQVRILNPPGMYFPIDASNYIGELVGDAKSPIGIRLIGKIAPQPYIAHAVSTQLYSQDNKATVPVDSKIPLAAPNFETQLNNISHPDNRGTVIKPPTKVGRESNPPNSLILSNPGDYVDNNSAFLYVDEDEARMIADANNGIVVSKQAGVCIAGPLNIGSALQDIRLAGAWRFNPMHQYQIPSTAITPQPVLVWDPPGVGITQNLSSTMSAIQNS